MSEEPKGGAPEEPSPAVWDYLRQRAKLDEEIHEKFARRMTVMFTDIKDSTTFFETRGDIEGVSMLQRHHQMVFPPIEAEKGRVVKGLGDGLMVVFPSSSAAVRAAMQIQRTLSTFNKTVGGRERIRLRIGIHSGIGLVENQDIFGDVVNAAARVQGLAEPDQIVVSGAVYADARDELGVQQFVPLGPAALKGKSEQVQVYEVIWSTEQRRLRGAPPSRPGATARVLRLDLVRAGDSLKVSSSERSDRDVDTLQEYEEGPYDEAEIAKTVQAIGKLLEGGDQEGRSSGRDLDKLIQLGRLLYEQLFPPQTRAKLADSSALELTLAIDDHLVQIPWELLHDGREFLCLRFGIGRLVSTRQQVAEGQSTNSHDGLRVLVVSDPRGDLPEARKEGAEVGGELALRAEFRVTVEQTMTREQFANGFGAFDIVHFAGHAQYDPADPASGQFLLSNGALHADELLHLGQGGSVPRLVFLNACQSGQTGEWSGSELETTVFGLANSILLTGVKHYIGSIRRLYDSAGLQYALEFYRQLAAGHSVGVAVRDARRLVAQRQGKASLTWASYVLYGDPTSVYLTKRAEPAPGAAAPAPPKAPAPSRRRSLILAGALAGLVVVGSALYMGGAPFGRSPAGDSPATQALSQADGHLAEGQLDQAKAAYTAVLALPGVTPGQRATAYNRLGRIAAQQGKADEAGASYEKARGADASNWESLSNLGALWHRQGRYAEAAGMLERAATLRPDDPVVQGLLKDSRELADQDRQKRIDDLVADVTRNYRSGTLPRRPRPSDEWTSQPLTLSLLPLDSRNATPLREGEQELLLLKLGQALEGQTRVRLVERGALNKLLEELKLGSTALVDPDKAVAIGRLLSARLILVGGMRRSESEWQVTVRVIETETSAIVASAAESGPLSQPMRDVPDRLVAQLRPKLLQAYPLRGRVAGVGSGQVTLNVSAREGAVPGQKLQLFRDGAAGQRDLGAKVEIVEVDDKRAQAKLLDPQPAPTPGLKFQQMP